VKNLLLRSRRALGPRCYAAAIVVGAFVTTRFLVMAATHAGAARMTAQKSAEWAWWPDRDLRFAGAPPPGFLAPTIRWDSNFYISLARAGYPPRPPGPGPNHHLAFFPLYPLLVRATAGVLGGAFWTAFGLSNFCALAAALMLVQLGRIDRQADGLRAAVLFLASPGAHFFAYPYTEALFAALLAASLLLVRHEKFLLAAIPGAAAAATRSPGVAAAVGILAQGWKAAGGTARSRALAGAALSLAGVAGFAFWCHFAQGDALAFLHVQAFHHRSLSVLGPMKAFLAFDVDPDYYLVSLASLYVAARMIRRTPIWMWTTAAFLVLLPIATGTLQAMIRYQAANVPLICGVPPLARGRKFWWVVAGCAALMALEAYLFGKGIGHF